MDTFLAPLPSPQPIAAAASDPELSSFLASLLAMTNDDDFGELPQPQADESFAADSTTLPAFFAHHHQPAAMPFQPAPAVPPPPPPPPPSGPVDAARHEATRRPAKRKRGQRTGSGGGGGDSTGQPAGARSAARPGRRMWVRARSTEWWDRLDAPSCPDAEFRRAFRMSRATFAALCGALGGAVAREDTALRAAVPVRRRVAACVWRLATAEPLREVARRFGLGISTCHSIVPQVCRALAAVLMPAAIRWPEDPAATAAVAAGFEAASGIPGVVGAVYTTRVPIVAPKANVAAYYDRRLTERNQKASFSVALQAVSDAAGAFTNVYVGLPGSLSDAAVLGSSALWARRGELGVGRQRLVGGASYPLTEWMLVPYAAHRDLTWAEHEFNGRVAAARGVARGAVRRLKARWRCLRRRAEVRMQDLPSLIAACCVLHNVCERAGEGLDPELMEYDELDDAEDDDVADHDAAASSAAAVQARDRIAQGLLHGE